MRLLGLKHQTRNNCEEAWNAVLSAETTRSIILGHKASLGLKSLKHAVQISGGKKVNSSTEKRPGARQI